GVAVGAVRAHTRGTDGRGGAVAGAAADYPAALQALEARFVLKGEKAERTVSAADFFVDTFSTALEPSEILREVIVPIDDSRTGTSYQKVPQPASGFAIVGVAARVRQNAGKISFVRIGVTGLSNRAYRARAEERALEGRAGSPAGIQAAGALVARGVDATSALHASADSRRHLAAVHATRAITTALSRIV